jgi:hypothetical protein
MDSVTLESLSGKEHTVAVTEEPVTLMDGMTVGGQNVLAACEGADQHDQT